MHEELKEFRQLVHLFCTEMFDYKNLEDGRTEQISFIQQKGKHLHGILASFSDADNRYAERLQEFQYALWGINKTEKPIELVVNSGRLVYILDIFIEEM